MAVLRPFLNPTVGMPKPVIARRRLQSMTDPEFYQQNEEEQLKEEERPQFTRPPESGQYIQEQLAKMQSRAAPPKLEPGARVQSPSAELVQPKSFQQFYEQLNLINQSGLEQLGATQARSAFRRMQSMQNVAGQTPPGPNRPRLQGGGGQDFGSGVPSNPQANFRFAQEIAPNFGWGSGELSAWYTLGMKESGWRNNAQNPTSTAYGIGQFLNSTWAGVGIGKTSDPRLQVEAMARYIRNRYGSPSRALAFHRSHNWY